MHLPVRNGKPAHAGCAICTIIFFCGIYCQMRPHVRLQVWNMNMKRTGCGQPMCHCLHCWIKELDKRPARARVWLLQPQALAENG